MITLSEIKKMDNNTYRVISHKGKNLGTYNTKHEAEERLRQVEFFKHRDENKLDNQCDIIDLTNISELSYSCILRELNKQTSKNNIHIFLNIYKEQFDLAINNGLQKPDMIALQNTLILFNKKCKIKLNSNIVKNAALTELGNPKMVGEYLANIIKFIMMRISDQNRQKSMIGLKNKLYNLNEYNIANTNMPASAAIGQSITFVKHVLFNHNAPYIRQVLNTIIANL
jgi:hypothetical protein